jgi:hypothetical protein
MQREDLQEQILEALQELGGQGTIVEIAKIIYKNHVSDLEKSGDLFYTWQYDMRWAATFLRKEKKLKAAEKLPSGIWAIQT